MGKKTFNQERIKKMQELLKTFKKQIRVQVSKSLRKKEALSILNDFNRKKITCALSKGTEGRYTVWRQSLNGDLPLPTGYRRHGGVIHDEVIETDPEILAARNFIAIWQDGKLAYKAESKKREPKPCAN